MRETVHRKRREGERALALYTVRPAPDWGAREREIAVGGSENRGSGLKSNGFRSGEWGMRDMSMDMSNA